MENRAGYLTTPPALGASGAVNAVVLLSALMFPWHTVYLYMVVPVREGPAAGFASLALALCTPQHTRAYTYCSIKCLNPIGCTSMCSSMHPGVPPNKQWHFLISE
jgi:hypothetical protein